MNRENVEAIYALSALQQGLLFHHLYAGAGTGEYFEQFCCSLQGEVDLAAFESAWQRVLGRHAVLRTAFVWDGLERPVQVVHRRLRMPVEILDWRALADREARLASLLADDRRRGFELTAAPLTRVTLVRLEEDRWELVWSHHHLLLDGWSASIVLSELFAVYESLTHGRELQLGEPRPFRDYIAWLQQRDLTQAETVWRRLLAGIVRPTGVPADHDPRVWTGGGEEHRHAGLVLSAEQTRRLLDLGRREAITLNTLVQGAWALLLAAWSGEEDVLFGVTTAGRPLDLAGVDTMVGLFVNTVPVRVRRSSGAPLLGWLRALQELNAEVRQHDHTPLVQIQEWSDVPRGLPLFETIVAFENHPRDRAVGRGDGPLRVVGAPVVWERTHYPLTLQAWPGEALELRLLYDRRRYEPATADRLLEHLRHLLEEIAGGGARRLGDLSLVPDAERQQLLREWNGPRPASGPAACLHELFAAQVDADPHREAVVLGDERLTYAELDRRANRLAWHLLALGVGPGVPVAVCLERSLDLVVALLGVLKAGGYYVPLDPAYPAERLAWILADTGAPVAVTAGEAAALSGGGATLVRLDLDAATLAARSPARPRAGAAPESLAYVIYTSGSTGRPKGVRIPHANVVRLFRATGAWFGFGPDDVWTLFHSFAFDFSVWEIWGALLHGGRLVVVPWWVSRAPDEFLRLLAAERVTVLNQTPSAFRQLAAAALAGPAPELALREVVFGGEALELESLRPWLDRFGDRRPRLVNMYGITETTVHVTFAALSREDLGRGRASGIGVPIPDLTVHLLGRGGELLPVGAPGEICVGGAGLAEGYLGRPELTAERFVPDPFGDGGRLYRSGDLARRRLDGTLEYLGRIDQQVKIRGFRIEPGEIEALLDRHPAVQRSVVLVREDGRGDRRLAAYYAERPGEVRRDLEPELRTLVARRLPDYMVPAFFVAVPAIPLTPNGKVDVRALPAPEEAAGAAGADAPRDAVEERLAALWGEVLGREQVGIHSDFFALGGHSLLATRLLSRLRETFRVDLGLRTLFESPTVAGVAAAIALEKAHRAEGDGGAPELPSLVPDPAAWHAPFPLTDVQQAYWVGRRTDLDLGGVAAHLYVELEGEGIDLPRLERAWRRLVEHHAMLRAVVEPDGRQRVLEQVPAYRFAERDLRGRPAAETEAALEAVRHEMSHQVLPPDRWPLFDIRAARLDGGRTRLHVSLDVLILDGWSLRLLADDLARAYADPEAALPPLEITFRDYVLAEIALRDGALYRRALEHWRSRLATLPPAPELPLAVRPESVERPRFQRWDHRVEPDRWQFLQERARAAGLTASTLLLAAFAQVLAAWSKSPRFTLNLTLFNRLPLHPQVDRLLGDFTSLTLLEVDASGTVPFETRARRLQERLWTDLDHRFVSGIQVLRDLARARGGPAAAAMPVVFTSTLNLSSGEDVAAPLPAAVVHSITQTPQVWLDHQATEIAGGLSLVWDAVAELFPEGMIDAMFAAYREAVERLVDDEAAWAAPWPCLVPAGQLALYAAANGSRAPEPEVRLEALFAAQAACRPEATAVVAASRAVTYGELDRRSARLARALRERGAGPGQLVGVVMEKGWEQVVAVLGILRAGAAYLPVDPGLPAERLRYLLEHGQAAVALTQERVRPRVEWPAGVEVLAVDGPGGDAAPEAPAPEPAGTLGDLAYVIFTSGSTGLPKGVVIDHRGAVNTVLDVNRRFGVGPGDRVLGLSALHFDLSVWDVFGTLAAGGTLVLPEAWAVRDPSHWLELMVREGVTVWNSVPALLEMLVEYAAPRGESLPSSLRVALLSGDWIPVTLPDRFRRLAPGAPVVSLGGATEASIWSILHPIGEVDPAWASIPYGRAMDNQSFHVLDGSLEPRPVWVPGDLYIGGIGLALGYWRDEEKTRAAFVTHPRTGARLYRTGDLGRWLPSGEIEFLGREDDQVKVQGHRIELGEIEAVLAQHPGVQAGVVAARGQHRDRRLVAWVVPAGTPAAAPPAASAAPGGEGLAESLAYLDLKLRQPGLRRAPDLPATPLPAGAWDPDLLPGGRLERRSHRRFAGRLLPLTELGALLGCLTQVPAADGGLPRRRYGSAGSLYPVQVYLWVRPGRVEGLEGGTYYHDPVEHRLVLLEPGTVLPPETHLGANRAIFEASAFSLFLVGKMEAIRPAYGERSLAYALLEAGLITQLLEMTAPAFGLGLCQIGQLAADRVLPHLALDPDHELLHSLAGGPAAGPADEPAAGPADLAGELESFLRGKLPDSMVPRSFVFVRELPLTPNGKVDRRALPDTEAPRPLDSGERRPPRSALERDLAQIVREVLGLPEVGVDESFFELGGTSVHLVQIHGRLRQTLGREVPLTEMFNHPTVRALARHLSRGEAAEAADDGAGAEEKGARRRLRRERRRRGAEGAGPEEEP